MSRVLLLTVVFAATVFSQDDVDRLTVPFREAGRPRVLRVGLMHGSIVVKGYSGSEAIIEARHAGGAPRDERRPDGLRRIHSGSSGLTVEEENNVIKIGTHGNKQVDLTIQVPTETSLRLSSHNGKSIEVENISGDIEASHHNGSITIRNVSGSVVANTLNGSVNVVFDRITSDKPMSFSSLNGTIDVTLPPDAKARLKMKTHRGDVWSDFDVKLEPAAKPVVEEPKPGKGRYRVSIERGVYGTINGGGPEFQFTTLNGSIYIRKKK